MHITLYTSRILLLLLSDLLSCWFAVSLTFDLFCCAVQDFSYLWQLLSGLGEFGGGDGVSADRCIAGLVGEMNEERKAIVRKVRNLSCLPPSSCLCGGYLT